VAKTTARTTIGEVEKNLNVSNRPKCYKNAIYNNSKNTKMNIINKSQFWLLMTFDPEIQSFTSPQSAMISCIIIELFKMIKGIYDPTCISQAEFRELSKDLIRTRGNRHKFIQHHWHYDLRKFNFTNRIIPVWNSLSNDVVYAETAYTFKNCLDRFWSNQDVLYDSTCRADLHCIGNCTIVM